jgi:hypothetical protein
MKVYADSDALVHDPSDFSSLASTLQYLTFTRLGISYVEQQIYLHMHDPRTPHLLSSASSGTFWALWIWDLFFGVQSFSQLDLVVLLLGC